VSLPLNVIGGKFKISSVVSQTDLPGNGGEKLTRTDWSTRNRWVGGGGNKIDCVKSEMVPLSNKIAITPTISIIGKRRKSIGKLTA
jgi:hypothetical protein